MLYNYLKVSVRNLRKNPLFSGLNVMGLSLGMAVSLLLFMHVRQEQSFDTFHTKADRISRVILNTFWDPTKPETIANAPNVVGPAMKEAIPAVEQFARVLKHEFGESAFITAGDHKLVEDRLYWVDPQLFEIFDFQTVTGDLKSALNQPNTVALSRSATVRYFGTSNPVGQTIKIDQLPPMEVKAVYEDLPANSSLDPKVMGGFQNIKWANNRLVWSNASFETWVLLNPDADRRNVETQMAGLLDKNVPKEEQRFSMWLQPLRDVHFHSAHMRYNYSERVGDPRQTGMLGALALAILMIASFNYMNLSTARSQLRFKEVGINKTMGASQQQLVLRFYVETGILSLLALLVAIGLLAPGIPLFNKLADKELHFTQLFAPEMLSAMLGVTGVVTLLAGSYPAFFLSAFLPKSLLQTSFRKNTGAGWLRRSLVTAQFTAALVLIVGTIVLYKQMEFIREKKLGFEPEQVVAITTTAAESKTQLDALILGCRNVSSVTAVCRAQTFPGNKASLRSLRRTEAQNDGPELLTNRVTPDFEKVLGIKLLSGTTLPEKQAQDTVIHVVLNKKAVEYLGLTPENAIGQKVYCGLGSSEVICGVVENFHAESLHKPLGAYAFHDAETEPRRYLLVKMNTRNVTETMKQLEAVFTDALPQSAFEYKFLDEHLQKLYRSESRTASVVYVFSLLSILISCLGLFGLAAFAAEQRVKEIGVRKVLGASVAGITGLLARDFVRLVVLAALIASPVAYYFLNAWLAEFAYHIDIQWWYFLLAGALAVTIAFMTVGFQSVRAALANPVDALKNE